MLDKQLLDANACFVLSGSRLQISAWWPAIKTVVFSGFPQPLKANAKIVP